MGNGEREYMNAEDLRRWLNVAIAAAKSPASQIMKRFHEQSCRVESKADGSPVTIADREAEDTIRQVLHADQGPQTFDILGEEGGLEGSGTRYRWLVDPIDGTRSFINRIPLFGTIVALEDTQTSQALLGVIHLPGLGMTCSAARGFGASCNGGPVRVSEASDLSQTLIVAGDIAQFTSAHRESQFQRMVELCPYLRCYTDCFGHALVIQGSAGAMLDPALNPWDVRATQVIVEEAGGTMLLRDSKVVGKVDALFGGTSVVKGLASTLSF